MLPTSDWHPIFTVLAGIPIALITAWVTVRLALRRFQSETWFERRIEAYTRVIESLHCMKQITERQVRAERRGIEIPTDAESELVEAYCHALADLRRVTDLGALVFSADAIHLLEQLDKALNEASDEQSWWEHLDADAAAIKMCLISIRNVAKRELRA